MAYRSGVGRAGYVMWKGTPHAHVMLPVGERPNWLTGYSARMATAA